MASLQPPQTGPIPIARKAEPQMCPEPAQPADLIVMDHPVHGEHTRSRPPDGWPAKTLLQVVHGDGRSMAGTPPIPDPAPGPAGTAPDMPSIPDLRRRGPGHCHGRIAPPVGRLVQRDGGWPLKTICGLDLRYKEGTMRICVAGGSHEGHVFQPSTPDTGLLLVNKDTGCPPDTMPTFTLRSERFAAEGSISAGAIRRNMGRSTLDPISLLVREAVQNAWDARIDRAGGGVSFSLHLGTLDRKTSDTLRRTVFKDLPPEHPLKDHLGSGTGILCFKDTGTVGLNGPVFHVARRGPQDDDARNFIRFVRDIGRGASRQLTGGTYGFGKSSFYVASEAATIIVFTRCRSPDATGSEDRLIACSLWNPTEDELHTGRHWWGVKHADGIAPLTGEKAAEVAEAIGLPHFRKSETGTVIAIIAPRFVEPFRKIGHDTARALAESLTTWFWPRMLPDPTGTPWIRFKAFFQNREIPVFQPQEVEPFRTMARLIGPSMEQDASGRQDLEITSEKPKALLGRLATAQLQSDPLPAGWKSLAIEGHILSELLDRPGGLQTRCHHIALMRSTWQVIRYLPCRPVRATGRGFAGIFMVDGKDEIESAFAQSEPPAHDDWVPDSLENDWHRRYVRIALRRIREAADQVSAAVDALAVIGRGPDLSRLSQMLGRHMPGGRPAGLRAQPGDTTKPVQREGNSIRLIDQGSLGMLDGVRVLTLSFTILGDLPRQGLMVQATPRVLVVGGSTEHDGDDALDRPITLGWRDPDGRFLRQERLQLTSGSPSDWQVVIRVPDETQVGVSLQVTEVAR